MSIVVNLRDFPLIPGGSQSAPDGTRHVFGQRRELPPDVIRIDRRTPWGNPFKVGDGEPLVLGGYTRDDVLSLYRDWLDRRLGKDPAFLDPLKGKRLACWCAPLPCHGDVIAEILA